jgi:hypothetical protein
MRALFIAVTALVLVGCAHPVEIKNLDKYQSIASREPLEKQTGIGIIASAPDANTLRVANAVGPQLGRHSAKVVQPYTPAAAGTVEVLARISVTPRYEGAGSNWLVNFPGLLFLAPSWAGYAYTVGYDFNILLTRAWDNAKIDAWTMPVTLDVRHSSGMLLSADYNPEVTAPAVDAAGSTVGGHVAREIVRRLNSEGRLWKLEPPPDWVPPQAIATTPMPPPVVAPPAPTAAAPAAVPTPPAPAKQAAPAAPAAAPPAAGAPLAKGGQARLKAGGTLRTRPQPAGDPVTVPAGTVLTLGPNLKNATGSWWFLTGAVRGWALEADLMPAP